LRDEFSFDTIISEGGLPHASSDRLHALVYILPLYSIASCSNHPLRLNNMFALPTAV